MREEPKRPRDYEIRIVDALLLHLALQDTQPQFIVGGVQINHRPHCKRDFTRSSRSYSGARPQR